MESNNTYKDISNQKTQLCFHKMFCPTMLGLLSQLCKIIVIVNVGLSQDTNQALICHITSVVVDPLILNKTDMFNYSVPQ